MASGGSGMYKPKNQKQCFTGHQYSGGAGSPPEPANVPGTSVPTGEAQSSGKVIHHRPGGENGAGTGENLDGFAEHHQSDAGDGYSKSRDTRQA